MSLPEIFERLRQNELQINTLSTKVTVGVSVLFTCGVFFWGVTSWLVMDKLTEINESLEDVAKLKTDAATADLKFSYQAGFNASITDQIKTQQVHIEQLNRELHAR